MTTVHLIGLPENVGDTQNMMVRTILVSLLSLTLFADQEPEGRAAFIAASIAYHQGAYDDAITGYQQTIALHHEVPFSKHMISRLWNLKGDIDNAIAALDEAAEFEFPGVNIIQTDPEFAAVRLDPRYPAILAKVRSNNQQQACKQRSRRRQFDFWLGVWNVSGPDGALLGVDTVELTQGDCLLRETWAGAANGDIGQSNTFYDRLTGYWRQVWMDPTGEDQDYYGELTDSGIVLKQIKYNGGLKSIFVSTYTPMPDGTVVQLSQRSTDDGATWTTLSMLTYTRKAQ